MQIANNFFLQPTKMRDERFKNISPQKQVNYAVFLILIGTVCYKFLYFYLLIKYFNFFVFKQKLITIQFTREKMPEN